MENHNNKGKEIRVVDAIPHKGRSSEFVYRMSSTNRQINFPSKQKKTTVSYPTNNKKKKLKQE